MTALWAGKHLSEPSVITTDAAALAIIVAIMLSAAVTVWLRGERDLDRARAALAAAARLAGRNRRMLAAAGIVAALVVNAWFHGHGAGH